MLPYVFAICRFADCVLRPFERDLFLTPPAAAAMLDAPSQSTKSFQEELPSQQSKNPTMRASAVATLFSLAAGASAFTVGGPAIVSRPVSFCIDGFSFPLAQDPKSSFSL